MTLFIVAFFPIAAVALILWLMLRPLADQRLAFREGAEPVDPSGFRAAEQRQHRFGGQFHARRATSQPTL
jgi:hypothetical protein